MEFANLDGSESSILEFANQCGHLGVTDPVTLSPKGGSLKFGETIELWRSEIQLLREATALHGHIRAGRHASLKSVIKWKSVGRRVVYESANRRSLIASERQKPYLFEMFRKGELVKPALAYLQQIANKNLEANAAPAVLWDQNQGLDVFIRPKNLLGAMWLQFSLSLTQGSEYRQCGYCGTYFEVGRGTGRSDKKYCSDSCRVSASRNRRKVKT